MSIISIFALLGGLALFLYGMNSMSAGLEKMAGGKLEQILLKMTSNRFVALSVGLVITTVIQSSSALTVMLVGLVNSGIMQFGQTIGVLMGSNIGTTVTAWLLSLAGIESDNIFINMLKPTNLSAILATVGIVLIMLSKKEKKKNIGEIFIGFAILMFGMNMMSGAMEPLAESETFVSLMTAFRNPFLALLAGALITCIIQSSSASVGILQALSLTGGITYSMAIPIIMGQNIGTCITAILSSLGASKQAKKVAVVHLSFNIIGTLIFLIPFIILNATLDLAFADTAISPFMIAIIHSIFNIATTFLLLPFTKQLEKLANRIIPTAETVNSGPHLDDRLITIPSVAVGSAFENTVEMSSLASDALKRSLNLMPDFDEKVAEQIKDLEERIDKYEDRLGTYLVKIAGEDLSDADSHKVTMLLRAINDFERIGDHACNLVKAAREMNDKKLSFSDDANKELRLLSDALCEILDLTSSAFVSENSEVAAKVEPLEQVIDKLIYVIKNRHIDRLQKGNCTIELGFILNDLLTNYERVSDHCSNIAVAIIETAHGSFKTHEYLHAVKNEAGGSFEQDYKDFSSRYAL